MPYHNSDIVTQIHLYKITIREKKKELKDKYKRLFDEEMQQYYDELKRLEELRKQEVLM